MLTQTPTISQDNYEAIIQLMQTYDYTYEQAQKHFHLLKLAKENTNLYSQSEYQTKINQVYEMEDNDSIQNQLPQQEYSLFTPKQLLTLRLYIEGYFFQRKQDKNTFKQKLVNKSREIKKKFKCLKCLQPKRLWRILKKKSSATKYHKIQNNDLNSSSIQSRTKQPMFENWSNVQEDWKEQLEQTSEILQQYLQNNKQIVKYIRTIDHHGFHAQIPSNMQYPNNMQPFLLVRKNATQQISSQIKAYSQKYFKIICLSNNQFKQIHKNITGFSDHITSSLAFYNIFQQLQIAFIYDQLAKINILRGLKTYQQFIIKNRLFKSIITRQMNNITLKFHQQSVSQEQQNIQSQRQSQFHQNVIKEQNMLYQSMLSSYTTKQAQSIKQRQQNSKQQKQKILLKSLIKQEPISSTPNGSIVTRNFNRNDTLQYVKNWILTEQQRIQFENFNNNFELYYGFPPQSLEQKNNQMLIQIFGEDQTKIKVIIKQN